ncbi:hypothetical protein [Paenibacillus puerhi]
MLNFVSGAIAASVYAKMVDQGAGIHWNSANSHPAASVYSNIYLVLAALHAGILLIYYLQFGRAKPAVGKDDFL